MKPSEYPTDGLSGRNRRLLHEWHLLDDLMNGRSDMSYRVARCNAVGLPVSYHVDYHLRSICGVEDIEHFPPCRLSVCGRTGRLPLSDH